MPRQTHIVTFEKVEVTQLLIDKAKADLGDKFPQGSTGTVTMEENGSATVTFNGGKK